MALDLKHLVAAAIDGQLEAGVLAGRVGVGHGLLRITPMVGQVSLIEKNRCVKPGEIYLLFTFALALAATR